MKSSSSITLLTVAFLSLIFVSCSSNDAQQKFEEEAYSEPSGFTQTDVQGKIINNNDDADDWRISPFYQSLINIEPAYPNPVTAGDNVYIDIYVKGEEIVSEIQFFYFNEQHRTVYIPTSIPSNLNGYYQVRIDSGTFTSLNNTPQNAVGLHRLFISDGNNNLITYGDIKIE